MPEPIRVTQVLNYFKEQWFVDWFHDTGRREANRVSKEALKIGTRVDELIKANSTPTTKDKAEVHSCIAAYNKWKAVYQPKSVTPCNRLFGTVDNHQITGEPDIMVDDVLVDIKCSNKIALSYWLQVNMYEYLSYMTNPKQ